MFRPSKNCLPLISLLKNDGCLKIFSVWVSLNHHHHESWLLFPTMLVAESLNDTTISVHRAGRDWHPITNNLQCEFQMISCTIAFAISEQWAKIFVECCIYPCHQMRCCVCMPNEGRGERHIPIGNWKKSSMSRLFLTSYKSVLSRRHFQGTR